MQGAEDYVHSSKTVKLLLKNENKRVFSQVLHEDADEKESLFCSFNKKDKTCQCWKYFEAFGKTFSTPLSESDSERSYMHLYCKFERRNRKKALAFAGVLTLTEVLMDASKRVQESEQSTFPFPPF